jgi:tetratricopeptide (TPR) repeat protein
MDRTPERSRAVTAADAYLERGFRFEQGGLLQRALDAYRDALATNASPAEAADAHLRIARVYRSMSDLSKSRDESREAARIANGIGADDLVAEAMNVEIGSLQIQGLFDEADSLAIEAMRRAKSPRVRGITLQNLGRAAAERRHFDRADRYFDESIAAFREANYEVGLAVALGNAARSALDRGDVGRSIEVGHEAIALARRLNALDVLLTTVQNQAAALVAIGNLDSAEVLLTEALGHFTSARNLVRQAECLEIMGQMSESRPDYETAARCYARARDLAITSNDQPLTDRLTQRLVDVNVARSTGTSRTQ